MFCLWAKPHVSQEVRRWNGRESWRITANTTSPSISFQQAEENHWHKIHLSPNWMPQLLNKKLHQSQVDIFASYFTNKISYWYTDYRMQKRSFQSAILFVFPSFPVTNEEKKIFFYSCGIQFGNKWIFVPLILLYLLKTWLQVMSFHQLYCIVLLLFFFFRYIFIFLKTIYFSAWPNCIFIII